MRSLSIRKSESAIDFVRSSTIIKFRTKSSFVPAMAARRPRAFLRRAAEASETRLPESSSLGNRDSHIQFIVYPFQAVTVTCKLSKSSNK